MSLSLSVAAMIAGVATFAYADGASTPPTGTKVPATLAFTMNDIDGKPVDLSTYAGRVIMFVNVASHCGNTPQYKALEKVYQHYKGKGFVILAFPANNFGGQEPGTNAEIKQFCTVDQYQVTFPVFSKISVKGEDIAPLYKVLTAADAKPKGAGEVSWNFEKILVGKDGSVVARFKPGMHPDEPEIIAAIEAALAG